MDVAGLFVYRQGSGWIESLNLREPYLEILASQHILRLFVIHGAEDLEWSATLEFHLITKQMMLDPGREGGSAEDFQASPRLIRMHDHVPATIDAFVFQDLEQMPREVQN